ncbi:hypothetical protein POAN111098_01725 [Polynucleobacter antarcticus]
MPLQISPSGDYATVLNRPLAVAAVVDSAQILGLPKLRLRDSRGNPYIANQSVLYESAFVLNRDAGVLIVSNQARRKAFIQSYVRR